MSNLQDWSKQFQQFQQINLRSNQKKKKKQTDEWSSYQQSTSSTAGWGSRQRDPVKELSDIAECRKKGSSDLDHWRFKESKSRFKSGIPGSTSGMSGSFSKAEKKSGSTKWIIIAVIIIFLLNVGISLVGTLFESIQESFTDAIQAVELEFANESEPTRDLQAPTASAEGEYSHERDEDSVFTLQNVTGMNDQQASDFMDIFEKCTMGVLWDMHPMSKFDEQGLTCYAVYPLFEDGWQQDSDMLVWLDGNMAIARLVFLEHVLYDAQLGVLDNTFDILYHHPDLQVDTISWGAQNGGGFVSGVISQLDDQVYYERVAPIVALYRGDGTLIDAYCIEAKPDGGSWTFSSGITNPSVSWDKVEIEVEAILAY